VTGLKKSEVVFYVLLWRNIMELIKEVLIPFNDEILDRPLYRLRLYKADLPDEPDKGKIVIFRLDSLIEGGEFVFSGCIQDGMQSKFHRHSQGFNSKYSKSITCSVSYGRSWLSSSFLLIPQVMSDFFQNALPLKRYGRLRHDGRGYGDVYLSFDRYLSLKIERIVRTRNPDHPHLRKGNYLVMVIVSDEAEPDVRVYSSGWGELHLSIPDDSAPNLLELAPDDEIADPLESRF
jgi:hypothetical protein